MSDPNDWEMRKLRDDVLTLSEEAGVYYERMNAAESKLAAAEQAAHDLAEDRANWRAQAQRAEAVIEAARECDRLAGSDPSLVDLENALAAYDRALSTTPEEPDICPECNLPRDHPDHLADAWD